MWGICFLTTDNNYWLKSLQYSILIYLNQFLPRMPQVLPITAQKALTTEPIGMWGNGEIGM